MHQIIMKIWRKLPVSFRSVLGEKVKKYINNYRYRKDINIFIKKYDINKSSPIEAIEIETINRCNGKCSFCPVNVNEKQRPYAKMNSELFYKIIEELKDINYEGKIALFSNNEPFLDERIIEWNAYVRNRLPNAYIYLYTNGSLLTIDKIKKIMKYLNTLIVDNYSDKGEIRDNIREVINWSKNNSGGGKIVVAMRKQDELLTSRGGQAPNKKGVGTLNVACFYPYKQLVVRPDGKVSLCCNDALGKYTLGDLNHQSIMEVWNSKEYYKIRKEMKINRRKNLKLCKNCDTKNYVGMDS